MANLWVLADGAGWYWPRECGPIRPGCHRWCGTAPSRRFRNARPSCHSGEERRDEGELPEIEPEEAGQADKDEPDGEQ